MSERVQDNTVNQQFLKDFMLAWTFYQRAHLQYQVPDLVMITGLLKSVGFSITKVEKMEGEPWAPGVVNGCTVEIQCPVSKTKITLSSPEAVCHCQKSTDSSWSLSWAGATSGLESVNCFDRNIARPAELTPEKEMVIRICLKSLISIIWPKAEDKILPPNPLCERLVKSLECVYEREKDSEMETSRSLQCIGSEGMDSVLTTPSSLSSLSSSIHDQSGVYSSTSTPMSNNSIEAASEKGNKKSVRLKPSTSKLRPKQPPLNSPYWESSTARAKRYTEMVKQRKAEKKTSK